MNTETIEIVDRGRGPQLSTTRITVSDVFYWLHRGDGWEEIHGHMPTLSRAEFDEVFQRVRNRAIEYGDAFDTVGNMRGPGDSDGAKGRWKAIYFFDPNRHLIEVAYYE